MLLFLRKTWREGCLGLPPAVALRTEAGAGLRASARRQGHKHPGSVQKSDKTSASLLWKIQLGIKEPQENCKEASH